MADTSGNKWTFWGVLKTFGLPALIIAGVMAVIVQVAILKQLDNATKRIDDLMAQVGKAEERFRQADESATRYKDLIDHMQKLDEGKIKSAMNVMENPNFAPMKVNEQVLAIRQQITVLARQIAMVYFLNDGDEPDLSTYMLKWVFRDVTSLKQQLLDGTVPAKWVADEELQTIEATARNNQVADEIRGKK